MNNVFALVRSARTSPDPSSTLNSDRMLAELIALNREMIEQLRLERLECGAGDEFLTGMIEQHEKSVALLQARLEGRNPYPGRDDRESPADY